MIRYPRLIVLILVFSSVLVGTGGRSLPDKPRNVIFFIADGYGPSGITMARDYGRAIHGEDALPIDAFLTGTVQTYSYNRRVTDSAASATAYASGVKTYSGAIGVDADTLVVGTLIEAAERAGMQTGLVSTAKITHATPAAFSAHVASRDWEARIADQQIRKGIELLLGGGRNHYLPQVQGGTRKDSVDAIQKAQEFGYQYIEDRSELFGDVRLPLLGLFSRDHMAYEIDRALTGEPSLAEMTGRALELLEPSESGFFLMVEAGRIDHAAHVNDPATWIRDVRAYNEAIEVALAFAERDGNTLIVATSDHETGGLSVGRAIEHKSFYDWKPEALAHTDISIERFMKELEYRTLVGHSADSLLDFTRQMIHHSFGLTDSTEALLGIASQAIWRAVETNRRPIHLKPIRWALGDELSERAFIGWTTRGHTAVDVNLYATGPGSDHFRGNMDNTRLGRILAEVLDLDLDAVTRELRR